MSRSADDSRTWAFAAGESRLLHAEAGTRWTATHGMLRFSEPPQWLGERMLGRTFTLRDGESHVVESAGWVTLLALADSCVHVQAPVSTPARWFGPGRAWRVPALSL